MRRLATKADVVIQNMRPGVVQRMGLAYDDLRQLNSQLIYVSISGFGQVRPMMATAWRPRPGGHGPSHGCGTG
eukprot:SAG25_NODE_2289_length_1750_cov_4.635373_3_plen_73_part_00